MFNARRLLPAIALSAALAAGALILVPASSEGSTQDNNRLFAYVVPNKHGSLPACSEDGSNCTSANTVTYFIYVANANRLPDLFGGLTRATLPNAYAVSSVDQAVFVDGVDTFDFTFTPPPNPTYRPFSGHWPSTVTCTPGAPPPCNVVDNPAVLPGENTAILYGGWIHGDQEPNGTYVFRYTVHGTLNGTPVDLTASSPPILMTN
jgi:hypothetical protein